MAAPIRASGYRNDPMGSECGNSAVFIAEHMFSAADAVEGTKLLLGEMGFDVHYYEIVVISSALGAGTTIDLGYYGKETATEYPEFFAKGINVATKNRQVLNTGTFDMRDKDGLDARKGEIHQPMLTVHGAPAEGSCVKVIFKYISHGH